MDRKITCITWLCLLLHLPCISAWKFIFERQEPEASEFTIRTKPKSLKVSPSVKSNSPKRCTRLGSPKSTPPLKTMKVWDGGLANGRPPMAIAFYERGNDCTNVPTFIALFYNHPEPWGPGPEVAQVLDFEELLRRNADTELNDYTCWDEIAPRTEKWEKYVSRKGLVPGDVAYNAGQGLQRYKDVIEVYKESGKNPVLEVSPNTKITNLYHEDGEAYGDGNSDLIWDADSEALSQRLTESLSSHEEEPDLDYFDAKQEYYEELEDIQDRNQDNLRLVRAENFVPDWGVLERDQFGRMEEERASPDQESLAEINNADGIRGEASGLELEKDPKRVDNTFPNADEF